jgi:hypothetical protein
MAARGYAERPAGTLGTLRLQTIGLLSAFNKSGRQPAGRHPARGCSPLSSHLQPADPVPVAEDRSAEGVGDRTGSQPHSQLARRWPLWVWPRA